MCRKLSLPPWLPWLLAVLFFAAGIMQARAESADIAPSSWPQQNESLLTPEPTQTDPWESFDQLWSDLKNELNQSEQDWQMLLDSLAPLRIEVEELRSLSMESNRLYEQSEIDRLNERTQAQEALRLALSKAAAAERSRNIWRTGAIVVGILVIVEAAVIVAALALR